MGFLSDQCQCIPQETGIGLNPLTSSRPTHTTTQGANNHQMTAWESNQYAE